MGAPVRSLPPGLPAFRTASNVAPDRGPSQERGSARGPPCPRRALTTLPRTTILRRMTARSVFRGASALVLAAAVLCACKDRSPVAGLSEQPLPTPPGVGVSAVSFIPDSLPAGITAPRLWLAFAGSDV